ncbi:MAG: Gluconate dehydratase, partial [uncultured Thermomicrobiales bacterium]
AVDPDRDGPPGRAPDAALRPPPHRRRAGRPRRDEVRAGRPPRLRPRLRGAPAAGPGPAPDRPPLAHRLRGRLPLRRQGRRDAGPLRPRHRPLGPPRAGRRDAPLRGARRRQPRPDARLQHLRRPGLRPLAGPGRGGRPGRRLRRPRRLHDPRRRARRRPPGRRHPGDEDLALRPVRRRDPRAADRVGRARRRAGAVPQDPAGGRPRDGDHGRGARPLVAAGGEADRPSGRGVRAVLDRGPDQAGERRLAGRTQAEHADADAGQRDADDPLRVPAGLRGAGGRPGDGRPRLVRRRQRGAQDRPDGGGPQPAGDVPRLRRADQPLRRPPPRPQRAERRLPGDGPLLHPHLLPPTGDDQHRDRGRLRPAADRTRAGDGAPAGGPEAAGRDRGFYASRV